MKPNSREAAITPGESSRATTAGDEAIKAVAGGEAVLQRVLLAEQPSAAPARPPNAPAVESAKITVFA
jgi:hypothetical protein